MKIQVPAQTIPAKTISVVVPAYTIPAYEIDVADPVPVPPVIPVPPTPTVPVLFAPTSVWSKKLTNERVHSNSSGFVSELIRNCRAPYGSPWISDVAWSVPFYRVDASVPKVIFRIDDPRNQGSPNDLEIRQGVRIPANAKASGGGQWSDLHLCVWDQSTDKMYSFWNCRKQADGSWNVSSAGIISNVSTNGGSEARLGYWNSATASHIPLAAGLITKAELEAGKVNHALSFAIPQGSPAFKAPASSSDGPNNGPNAIAQGQRFRFPANIVINPSWCSATKMLVEAVRDYGMINRDTAGSMNFHVEDPAQYGTNYNNTWKTMLNWDGNGDPPFWKVMGTTTSMGEFPFNQLQALA